MSPSEIISVLLFIVLVANSVLLCKQRKIISRLKRENIEVIAEENRLLEFSHSLGEALKGDLRPGELHRQIVEGVVKIAEASGGSLYLADRSGKSLVPTFVTRGGPVLVDLPDEVVQNSSHNKSAIDGYVRLKTFGEGEGVIGRVWSSGTPVLAANSSDLPGGGPSVSPERQAGSSMVAPLYYAGQKLGVLALSNALDNKAFDLADFNVFKAIAEQAAFALYSAVMFGEANEKRRLQNDLDVARDIQRILLPDAPPTIPGFALWGTNIPARHVSGDYFDFIKVDDHLTGIVIADVSGKGIPASLIMAMCRSVLRSNAIGNPSAADVLQKVNRQLYPDIQEDMFISMAYLIIDDRSREVTLARAGHDAPILCTASGVISRLSPNGMALGIDSGDVFERVTINHQLQMQPGDTLLLFTDGIPEALDADGEEFGMERLTTVLRSGSQDEPRQLVEEISGEVARFSGKGPQHDDITMVAIRRLRG